MDEVHGFKYFDERDLLGFVDGTENPTGAAAQAAVTIGAEDPAFDGGSYVIVQRYRHDIAAWNALSVEEQELVIVRSCGTTCPSGRWARASSARTTSRTPRARRSPS
jgi:putative iron-dependent peroxidase